MGQMDWKNILEISIDKLSEQKKEELYDEIVWFEVDSENEPVNLKHFISILTEILKFKGEQVDSLTIELDSLAAKQGQEEARRHQLQSVEQLYSGTNTDVENLRKELIQIELQNEKLMSNLQEKDEQILEDQNQIKKFSESISILEREKVELQRELASLQQEISEQHESKTTSESVENSQELLETISQKNKHISQLLVDIEVIERENSELRRTLSTAKDELTEATHHLDEISNENISLSTTIHSKDEKIHELGKEINGLKNQVEDLIDEKTKRDQELEELAKALDTRVQLWKETIDIKNERIEELKQKLQQFGTDNNNTNIRTTEEPPQEHTDMLNVMLEKRELQIEQLQNQLQQATKDLNETTALLERKERFSAKGDKTDVLGLKLKLVDTKQEVESLQKRVIEAEADARRKAEETADMIILLREYESGTYGLEEAIKEIKDLKKSKEQRESKIQELIQAGNELTEELNHMELENLALRKDLGLSRDAVVNVEGVASKQREEQKELNLLKKQLEAQENLIVEFKVEKHELLKKINVLMKQKPFNKTDELKFDEYNDKVLKPYVADHVAAVEANILEDKLKDVIEENEALRKGMHEILDSIKEAESNTVIKIESNCLERLLEALDSRHVSGWYHPAMRLQAQVFSLQGMNTILREELRLSRIEQQSTVKYTNRPTEYGSSYKIDTSYIDVNMEESQMLADNLKHELKILTDKLLEEQENNETITYEMNLLKNKLLEIKDQTVLIDEEYETEKECWQKGRKDMGNEIEQLQKDVQDKQNLIEEHEINWKVIIDNKESNELKKHLAEMNTKLINMINERNQLGRKVNILSEARNEAVNKINQLEEEYVNMKSYLMKSKENYNRIKEQFCQELENIEQTYEHCISIEEVNNIKQELYDITIKYRSTLQSNSDILKHESSIETIEQESGGQYSHQVRQLEEKCQQFEKKLAVMIESEKSFQKFQTKLTEKYSESVSKIEHQNILNKLRECEQNMIKLRSENSKLNETVNESNEKIKQIELKKAYHEFEHDALQRCILELQCISDDKSTIGRLTQEIHSLHVNEIKNQDELQSTKRELEKTQTYIDELQNHLSDSKNEMAFQRQVYNDKIKQLKSLILSLNKRFVGALPLLSEQVWSNQVKRVTNEKRELLQTMIKQQTTTPESEINHVSIENLRIQLKTLNFTKSSLDKRLEVAENVISKYEDLVNSLQSDLIKMENKYEKQLLEAHTVEQKFLELSDKEKTIIVKDDYEISEKEIKVKDDKKEEILKTKTIEKRDKEIITKEEESNDSLSLQIIENLRRDLEEKTKKIQDKNEVIRTKDIEITRLNEKLNDINKELNIKDEQLRNKIQDLENFKTEIKNKNVLFDTNPKEETESSEKKAYKVTVSSLENIIAQKETTIKNYQTLLEKTKEQNLQIMADLQNKCTNLQSQLNAKEMAEAKNKFESRQESEPQSDLRPFMNTYLTRIHELEDSLVQATEKSTQLSTEMTSTKQQSEHWYHMASERLKVITDLQLKLESSKSGIEHEAYSEIELKNNEIQRLQNIVRELKTKLETRPMSSGGGGNGEKNETNKSRLKNEIETYKSKIESILNHEKELKKEIQKLKDQISHLKPISGKSRDELLSAKEEIYSKKIKQLKEEIDEYKKREDKDKIIRKLKVDDEVEKWSEKKNWQITTEKLKQQLKDKTNQYDSLKMTHERLKDTVIKMERERNNLETKLKIKESLIANKGVTESLEKEICRLEDELRQCRKENEISKYSKSNKELIENLRRKIYVFENAQKGESKLAEELERAMERHSQTNKRNIKLEAENHQLKYELEKLKLSHYSEIPDLRNVNLDLDSLTEEESLDKMHVKSKQRRTADLEKAVSVLKKVVDKLQTENKRLHCKLSTFNQEKKYTEKIQIELQKSQANYLDSVEKCSHLENELKQTQLGSNRSEHEEIERLNRQLGQKCALLSRVKALLEKAADREKSLTEQINVYRHHHHNF